MAVSFLKLLLGGFIVFFDSFCELNLFSLAATDSRVVCIGD